MADTSTYPNHNIDPALKDYEWILSYFKAAWRDANGQIPLGYWFLGNNRYDKLKSYTLGKQAIAEFTEHSTSTDSESHKGVKIDHAPISIIKKFRTIALSKLFQRNYSLGISAVDSLSRTEEDDYFNKMKVKIMVREQLQQQNSPLANSPLLAPSQGEPQDMEQLQMQQDYSYKHILAQNAEIVLQYIHDLSGMPELRKRVIAELFDVGLSGYKEWMDENGMIREREVIAKNLVTSNCVKNDFSDAVHIGEVIMVQIADLVPYFTTEQIDKICQLSKSQWGNPSSYIPYGTTGSNWNLFKVQVLDMEFYSWDTSVSKAHIDSRGNKRFEPSIYENIKFTGLAVNNNGKLEQQAPRVPEENKGQPSGTFKSITRKTIYRGKWIVGSDMMYDYGLAQNMKRKQSSWWDTTLSYHLYAWNFYEMKYSGVLEDLLPVADAYQATWLKLQDLKASLIPYLINLDIDALENVALGKGGKNMTPLELTEFMFKHGVMVYRSSGGVPGNPNYKPASLEPSGQLTAFQQLYSDLENCVSMLYQLSGLNEATAMSPDPKQSEFNIANANQATNNALFLISEADKQLQLTQGDAVIQKMQIAVKLGLTSGYVKALGQSRIKFFEINPDFSLREFGLSIHDLPTEQEKQMLYQRMTQSDAQGVLDPSDWVIIERVQNLDEAAAYLSYKIKKGNERKQQEALQNIQAQGQSNTQSAMAIEQAKQQTIMIQLQADLQKIAAQAQADYTIEAMKKSSDLDSAHVQGNSKIISSQIQSNAKIEANKGKSLVL